MVDGDGRIHGRKLGLYDAIRYGTQRDCVGQRTYCFAQNGEGRVFAGCSRNTIDCWRRLVRRSVTDAVIWFSLRGAGLAFSNAPIEDWPAPGFRQPRQRTMGVGGKGFVGKTEQRRVGNMV